MPGISYPYNSGVCMYVRGGGVGEYSVEKCIKFSMQDDHPGYVQYTCTLEFVLRDSNMYTWLLLQTVNLPCGEMD